MAVPSFRALSHLIIPCNFHFLPTKRLDDDDFPRGLGGRETDWVHGGTCELSSWLAEYEFFGLLDCADGDAFREQSNKRAFI